MENLRHILRTMLDEYPEYAGLGSIAFCCIYAGVSGFPHKRAAEIADGIMRLVVRSMLLSEPGQDFPPLQAGLRFHVCRPGRAYALDELQVLCHTAGRDGVLHLQLAQNLLPMPADSMDTDG